MSHVFLQGYKNRTYRTIKVQKGICKKRLTSEEPVADLIEVTVDATVEEPNVVLA